MLFLFYTRAANRLLRNESLVGSDLGENLAIRVNLVKLKALRCMHAAPTCSGEAVSLTDTLDVWSILMMGFVGNLSLKWRRLGVGCLGYQCRVGYNQARHSPIWPTALRVICGYF